MKLSIVATLYRSTASVAEFCARAGAAAHALAGDDYEIVLVNDGSPDDSLVRAVALAAADPRLVVVDLARNYGHHKAMMAGLAEARGERVFLLDSDLEEEPEWLEGFARQMDDDGCDVVYGVQAQRKGGWFERWSGRWFYRLLNRLTSLNLPQNVVTARLMTRRYVDGLLQHREREFFIAGLWLNTGFDQRPHAVAKLSRSATTYTLGRKLQLLVTAVTSYSSVPLVGVFHLGLAVSALAGTYALYLLLNWAFLAKPLVGWTSLIASIWLLGGLVILFIGILGIYISTIFIETKRRPYAIVRAIHGRASDALRPVCTASRSAEPVRGIEPARCEIYGVGERTCVESDIERACEEIRRLGYAVVPSGLSTDAVAALAAEFDAVQGRYIERYGLAYLAERDEHNTIRLPLTESDAFRQLAMNPNILALVEKLVRGRFVLNQQNGIVNPSGARYNQGAWHRDLPYQHFVSTRPLAVNALYCVDDFTPENGASLVLPASHKEEAFPSDAFVAAHAHSVAAQAGSFIVLDCMCFHRGGENRSARVRRAVNHVYTIPHLKQQVSIPCAVDLGGYDEATRRLLGADWDVPASVASLLDKRPVRPAPK